MKMPLILITLFKNNLRDHKNKVHKSRNIFKQGKTIAFLEIYSLERSFKSFIKLVVSNYTCL